MNNNNLKNTTVTINPYYKEVYYNSGLKEVKQSQTELSHQHIFWNYMMNASMQNAVAQMVKAN